MLYLEAGDGRAVTSAEKAYKLLPNNPADRRHVRLGIAEGGQDSPRARVVAYRG